jgi:hypothetical protein
VALDIQVPWRCKRPELALGTFPKIGVADARELRAKLRDARDRGIDPPNGAAIGNQKMTKLTVYYPSLV